MTLHVLIADDERAARHGLVRALAKDGHQVSEAADGQAALDAVRTGRVDLVFLDLTMPGLDGREVLRAWRPAGPPCEVVVVTASDSAAAAVECLRLGAADYVTKPYELERLRAIARRVARRIDLERRVNDLQDQVDSRAGLGALIGASRPMRELYRLLERVGPAGVDVLIVGETGTGKELVARELHRLSGRPGPFVAVNTAAVAETLAESELFGHVRGAFTGAEGNRRGCFEEANRGTLFLDEIGDMPLPTQAKILRALQERVVQPVGSSRTVSVDVRVVTATHQDLPRAIAEGRFRQDLYYRIRGVELVVPPLRARPEDVLALANHFLDRLAGPGREVPHLAADAASRLLAHPWPGNVRELQSLITAAAALAHCPEIHAADLGLPSAQPAGDALDFGALETFPLTEAKERMVEALERRMITSALDRHAGNVSAAARQLGIHRQNLQQKMAQLGIQRQG
jgi:DNA-binding NtrC family response regulator